MILRFGPFTIDGKGMPALQNVSVYPPLDTDRPVTVYLAVVSEKRAAVEKWAKQLGAEVTEHISPLYEGDPKPLDIRAEVEADGVRVQVFTRAAAPNPAVLPWEVYAQPEGGARWLVNAFTTRERAERFAERHPTEYGELTIESAEASTAEKSGTPECPCQCIGAFCRCCDPETCECGPVCPVCDADGGAS